MGIRGNFSVTEERRLQRLNPEKGSIVIFLDGLNDNFYDLDEVAVFKDASGYLGWIITKIKDLDLYKAIRGYLGRATHPRAIQGSGKDVCAPKGSNALIINKEMKASSYEIAKRYLTTKSNIEKYCIQKEIACIFIAQPVPSYRYSHNLYFYDTNGGFSNRQAEYEKFIKEIVMDKKIIDLSGVLKKNRKSVYR